MRRGNIIKFQMLQQTAGGCPTISISPSSITDLTIGQAVTINIVASGGASPYTYAVSSGSLPTGLTLNGSTGVISGTPTTQQAATFTIKATDAEGCTGSKPYSFNIVFDTDAQAFITAATITDSTQQSAINTLVTSLKGYGIWSKMKAIYPFVGGTAAQHKWNLKDPRDLDAAFRLVFNGGWTHSVNGALPNGTNGYANTYLNISTQYTNTNSVHFSFYSRTNIAENSYDLGLVNTSVGHEYSLRMRRVDGNMSTNIGNYATQFINFSQANSLGFGIASRTASNVFKLFKNGVSVASNTTNGTPVALNNVIYLSAINNTTAAASYSTKQTAFASIGDGLTDTDAANLYTSVQAFQTTLGRSIGTQTVSDADAQAFVNAAAIEDQVQATAINNLTIGLKADGLWTKMKAVYPFVGGTAASHKFNLKNPLDTDAAFRLVFLGGWTHSSNGALPNGTNGAANTYLAPSLLTNNNTHLSVYSRTDSNGTFCDLGVSAPAPTYIPLIGMYSRDANNFAVRMYDYTVGKTLTSANTNSQGFYIGNRTSSTVLNNWKNGVKQATVTYTNTDNVTSITQNIHLSSINLNGTLSQYSNRQLAFSSIGDGLTDTDASNLYSRVQTYQTTLGRQV